MKSIHYLHTVFAWGNNLTGAETPNFRLEKRVVTRLSNCFWRERVATCSHVVCTTSTPTRFHLVFRSMHPGRMTYGAGAEGKCKLDLDVQRRGKGKRYRTLAPDLSRVMVGRLSSSTTRSTSG